MTGEIEVASGADADWQLYLKSLAEEVQSSLQKLAHYNTEIRISPRATKSGTGYYRMEVDFEWLEQPARLVFAITRKDIKMRRMDRDD
jgi:hypothetical protein